MVEQEKIISEELSLKEKVYSLKQVIKNYRMSLEGYVWTGYNDDYKYSGNPLATSHVIDLLVGMLMPWTENINLITIKDFKVFNFQQRYFAHQVNAILYKNPFSIVSTYKEVFQITDDLFQNICDVILGSKGFMRETLNESLEEKNNNFGGVV